MATKTKTRPSPSSAAKAVPTTKPKKNGAAQDAAAKKAQELIEGIIDKIIAARGVDNVGEGDQWGNERLDTCNDYVYDLAVEVRKGRAAGEPWWRIAYTLSLPGAGASAVQGKTGAAYARRLWERAWGKTYLDTSAPRDTKARKEERAVLAPMRPYFSDADDDFHIIQEVTGKRIEWVIRLAAGSGVVTSAQEAIVFHDSHLVKVVRGPKGRVLNFYEAPDAALLKVDPRHAISKCGPLRSVHLHNITRVGA